MAVTRNRDTKGQLMNTYHSSVTNMDYPSEEAAKKAEEDYNKQNKLKNKFAEVKGDGSVSKEDIENTKKVIQDKAKVKPKTNKSGSTDINVLKAQLSTLQERKAQSDLSNEDYAAIDTQINKLKAEIKSLETGEKVEAEPINPQLYNNGQTQLKILNKADELIEKHYNSKNGTFAELEEALRAEGANDDTIAKIIEDHKLDGTKAQEWLKKYNNEYNENAKALGKVQFEDNAPVTKEALEEAKHKEYENFKNDSNKKVEDIANSESEIDTNTPDLSDNNDTANQSEAGNSNLTEGDGGRTDDENKDKMAEFWKAFKAGAFRAYPMLQAIGDALSQQAKMTMDRANILTGQGSDLSVYEGKDPSEYFFNEDYEYRQAFLDAEAGNYEGVKELLMKGKVTLEQVAAALKLSDEDVDRIFGQEMRSREADTVSKELSNEETLKNEIRELDKQIADVNKDINALQGNDVDTYLSVLEKYLNIHSGLDTTGSSSGSSTSKNDTAGGNIGGNVGNAAVGVSAGISGSHAEGTTSTSQASRNKDLGALAALPKGKDFAQKTMEERNKANDELIASLQTYKQSLENQKANAQKELDNIRTNQNAAQTGGKNKILIPSSRDMTTNTSGGNENVTEQQ